jgi:hypothetical protein
LRRYGSNAPGGADPANSFNDNRSDVHRCRHINRREQRDLVEMHGVLNMRNLLIAALFLVPFPAFAGTAITVSVGATTETWTLSDTDQQKFEAWVQTAYKCKDAGPSTPCTPYTLAESEALWARAILQGTADNVTQFQNTVAATAAINATTPIGFNVGATKKK